MAIGDYADHFWGEKHIGYHVLYDNLKRNEQAIDELNVFIKDNISIQDDLLKFLGKTVNRVNSFITGNGAFVDSWRLTKGTFELWVEIQTTLVKNLADLSKEVIKFHDEQVKSRKRIRDQDVIDAVNLMQTTTTCLQKAKETYQQRSNEMAALGSDNVGGKEFVKAKTKLIKAHEEYRTYVEKYAGVRDDFEEKMVKSAAIFQTHDSAFLQQFKTFFFNFARHLNDSQNAISQVSGDYTQSLERVDIQQIMLRFIEERGTGTERPQVIRWSESDEMPVEFEAHISSSHSAPSSSNSSAVVAGPPAENVTPTVNDLLSINSAWGTDVNSLKSPTDSDSEPAHHASNTNISSSYVPPQLSSWLGRQKIGNWRKKHASQSNLSTTPTEAIGDFSQSYNESKGGFLRRYRKSKNSGSETPVEANRNTLSKEDVHGLGGQFGADGKNEEQKYEVDAEGFTIRKESTATAELPPKWSSESSSEEEDESEFQTSKIKALQIKPLAPTKMGPDSSIEEIKNAVGHMSLRRSSTLDKDPWCPTNSNAPAFSQSLNTTAFAKPLRTAFTGDDSINRKFSEFDYPSATAPGFNLDFSQSIGSALLAGSNIARARPRSQTPNPQTTSSTTNLSNSTSLFRRKDSFGAEEAPPFGVSTNSLGSLMNLSGWAMDQQSASNSASPLFFNASTTSGLNRVKIPIAMGINEYVHAWFKGEGEKTVVRVFGTVMISVPASFITQLTDNQDAREPLRFSLKNAGQFKTVQPNSRLLSSASIPQLPQEVLTFTIPKEQLANFVLEQQQSKPNSDFYNIDLLRYELSDAFEAPLTVNSYWKTEATQTDLRIDYALNTSENTLTTPLINVLFEVRVNGKVESYNSDPEAKWNSETQTLSFSLTELTRHGGSTGSLKARLKLTEGPSKPAQTVIHFQTSNATASNVGVQLESDSAYQLSLVRRKVIAGTYLSDPQART